MKKLNEESNQVKSLAFKQNTGEKRMLEIKGTYTAGDLKKHGLKTILSNALKAHGISASPPKKIKIANKDILGNLVTDLGIDKSKSNENDSISSNTNQMPGSNTYETIDSNTLSAIGYSGYSPIKTKPSTSKVGQPITKNVEAKSSGSLVKISAIGELNLKV